MLVAGVDVGNSTTELAVAEFLPGATPRFLEVLRRPTSGRKGDATCAEAVCDLVERAGRRVGRPLGRLLLARLDPVDVTLRELGRTVELDLAGAIVARPASATPSGTGVAAGRLVSLQSLAGESPAGAVVPVVVDIDFEEAAARLRAARDAGWRIVAAIVRADDGVLIGNRFDRSLPILDEVADAASLPLGGIVAVEVAGPGATVERLADPVALAALLDLDSAQARAARRAARAVAGQRAALVVRDGLGIQANTPAAPAGVAVTFASGEQRVIDERSAVPPPGEIVRCDAAEGPLRDLFWCPLPLPRDDGLLRRTLARDRPLAVAALAAGDAAGLHGALVDRLGIPVDVVCEESVAALLGAATTPRVGSAPIVLDLGGGTVDLAVAGHGHVVVAGAGELVTRICEGLLGCPRAVAEHAKRHRAARVETPFVLHHEDGTRSFLGEPAPPASLARLCYLDGGPQPIGSTLAPEVWASLRHAAKRDVIGRNVRRALDAAGAIPPGELVLLAGGCASDAEVVDAVSAELEPLDVAVARANVLGRHGPRAAVAVGLVLAADGRR